MAASSLRLSRLHPTLLSLFSFLPCLLPYPLAYIIENDVARTLSNVKIIQQMAIIWLRGVPRPCFYLYFYFALPTSSCTCSQRQSRAINEFKLENLLYAAKLLKAARE